MQGLRFSVYAPSDPNPNDLYVNLCVPVNSHDGGVVY